jgi:hypothetical protein
VGNFDIANASPEVIREVKQDVSTLEKALRGGAFDVRTGIGLNLDRTDTEAMHHELSRKKAWLQKYTPKKLTGAQANKAYARVKELKEKISEKLLPNKEFHQPYATNQRKERDFQIAVQHEAALLRDRNYKRDVQEYRALLVQLDPEDPTVRNIEALRNGKNVRIRR